MTRFKASNRWSQSAINPASGLAFDVFFILSIAVPV